MSFVRNVYPSTRKVSNAAKITIKNLQKKIPVAPRTIANVKKAILEACASEAIKKIGEINVCFVGDKDIRELNLKYLGRDAPTDVIVFDFSEGHNKSADIVISTDTALFNARAFRTTALYELYLYVIHGLLHVLGYNDKSKKERLIMRKKEKSLLRLLGLAPSP